MVEVVSIHRKQDLRKAQLFGERLRSKLNFPAHLMTDAVVERLADMLRMQREGRQNLRARRQADMAALRAEADAEFARFRAVLDALRVFNRARKALDEALATACAPPMEQVSEGAK